MEKRKRTSEKSDSKPKKTVFFSLIRFCFSIFGALIALAFCICLQSKIGMLKNTGTLQSTVDQFLTGVGSEKEIIVTVLDFEEGNSTLIQCGKATVLVDGGTRKDGKELVSFLESQNIKKLNAVIATSMEENHTGGLCEVLTRIKTDRVFLPESSEDKSDSYFQNALEASGVRQISVDRKKTVSLKGGGKLKLFTISDSSKLCVRFGYKVNSFLLMGPLNVEEENSMLQKKSSELKSNVLILGEASAENDDFLQSVEAEYVVCPSENDDKSGDLSAGTLYWMNPDEHLIFTIVSDQVKVQSPDS